MKVYTKEYKKFAELAAAGSFFGGPFSTIMSGVIVDYFKDHLEIVIPANCVIRALLTIPINAMIFY